MTSNIESSEFTNYECFRDSLSAVLIRRLTNTGTATKPNRRSKRQASPGYTPTDAEDLTDFIDYIAAEIFVTLPLSLRTLDHHVWSTTPAIQESYSLPLTAETTAPLLNTLDPSILDSLIAYGIINSTDSLPATTAPIALPDLLAPVLTSYLSTITTPPPPPSSTKGKVTACEICGRDWINLSYHHLIPRMVHAKVVKRGWHRPDELQNVAWLCGACHKFVHHFAGHEDLARNYYTVELLMEAEEVQEWAAWVGKLRWKGLG
ncbi:hypothetical protein OQA88_8485 [Cercophora sp. LCS_1]